VRRHPICPPVPKFALQWALSLWTYSPNEFTNPLVPQVETKSYPSFIPYINLISCFLKDYLYDLVSAVRTLAPESHDSHLYALEVRKMLFLLATPFDGDMIIDQS
jgi:hypothetical protein